MHDDLLDARIEDLPSICAVTGFFVMNVGAMERILYTVATTLGITATFAIAEEWRAKRVIERLRDIAPRLVEADDFRGHLEVATDALDLRHAVVHGILVYDEGADVFDSHRPRPGATRRGQADGGPAWLRRQFREGDLFESAKAVRRVSAYVLNRQVRWYEGLTSTE